MKKPSTIENAINGLYLIEQEIGRGGMGIVYQATNRLNGEAVALKQVIGLVTEVDNGEGFGIKTFEEDGAKRFLLEAVADHRELIRLHTEASL